MKRMTGWMCLALVLALSGGAWAELQNVEVGGEVKIRGRYWNNSWSGVAFNPFNPALVRGRAVGPFGVRSFYDWDDAGNDRSYVEQRTSLSVKADFTGEVATFIELHDFAVWGEDFRSVNYVAGLDTRANSVDDVEVYQAYIEACNMWGVPLRMRVGRQDLVMGEGWLVGNKVSPILARSFDALRLTYTHDLFEVDAFAAKLAESFSDFGQDDVDLYGLYANYTAMEVEDIALFWYWLRDDSDLDDSPGSGFLTEWLEDVSGVNDYGDTNIHTVGMRVNGAARGFDWDAKVAYQFGDAGHLGQGFTVFGGYGDDDADYDYWAFDAEAGYSFDCKWSPRVYLGGAWYEGEDNRDMNFWQWLNPFRRPEASGAFNRLFSDYWYTATTDILGGASAFSNFWQVRGGISVKPTECFSTGLKAGYFWADETFDMPIIYDLGLFSVGNPFPFATQEADDELGAVATWWFRYDYSDDLYFTGGWERFFSADGITDGNFVYKNGLEFSGGTSDRDGDYFWIITGVKF